MNIFVETDLGRDPDDLFSLLYFISCGINIVGITITPGDPDQIAIGRMVSKIAGRKIPIFASKSDRNKSSSGGIHTELLNRMGMPLTPACLWLAIVL